MTKDHDQASVIPKFQGHLADILSFPQHRNLKPFGAIFCINVVQYICVRSKVHRARSSSF